MLPSLIQTVYTLATEEKALLLTQGVQVTFWMPALAQWSPYPVTESQNKLPKLSPPILRIQEGSPSALYTRPKLKATVYTQSQDSFSRALLLILSDIL